MNDGGEVVVVLVEPPVREPLGVVVQQAARLVMSPGGAWGTVGGGAETENITVQSSVGNTWQSLNQSGPPRCRGATLIYFLFMA